MLNFNQTDSRNIELMIDELVGSMYFLRPGIIKRFDKDNVVVDAIVGVQFKISDGQTATYVDMPLIKEIPLILPFGPLSGYALTWPIREGDPCMLFFSDRYIHEFIKTGQSAPPEAAGPDNARVQPRMHHMGDAMCWPGLMTKPTRIANWNNNAIELRDSTGQKVVRVMDGGIEIGDGTAVYEMKSGRVSIEAPAGFYVNAPNVRINDRTGQGYISGTLEADNLLTTAGFNANGHRHSGVETGPSNTGTFV